MHIRRLLKAGIGLALAVVGVRLVMIEFEAGQTARLDRAQAEVQLIARDAAGLLGLGQDYVLHTNPRAARQWRAVHAELAAALERFGRPGESLAVEAAALQDVVQSLPALFGALESATGATDAGSAAGRRETLADHLVGQTKGISDTAFDMAELLTDQRRALARQQKWVALATQSIWLVLVLALSAFVVRRLLRPIERLKSTAGAVRAGNLAARNDYRAHDEFGALAHDFDAMTVALQEREAASQATHQQAVRSDAFQERAGRIAGLGGWEVDLVSGTLMWSRQTREIHGVPADYQPSIDTAMDFYAPESRPVLTRAVAAAIKQGTSWDLELPFETLQGRALWVRVVGEAEYAAGRAVRLVGAFHDVTARHDADEALRLATRQADAANASKSAFLANMSHEIRTPMNAVIGLTYLLGQTALDRDQQFLLAKVDVASRSLLGVINDVLDLSKIEAGEMTLEDVAFDLSGLLDEVAGVMSVQARAHGLELTVDVAPDMPTMLRGDSGRVRQILLNLLGNSIKFTERGSVRLQVGGARLSDAVLTIRFAVLDTGIGIAPQALSTLFAPFTQADVSTTRRFGGTGLGLSIVKRLTEMMGGTVGASSNVGVGSEFWFQVPFVTLQAQPSAAVATQPIEALVVDDHDDQRIALCFAARALGWRSEAVATGERALVRVRERLRVGPPLDVLVIDWQMPGLDGLQTLAALHEEFGPDALPGVVMVTALDRATLQAAPHAELADAVLTKPVTASSLFNAVHAAVAGRCGDAERVLLSSALDSAGAQRLPGVRLLVVDDNSINLEVAQRILQGEGALVTLAQHGEEALSCLRASPLAFDAVLMDVQMPVLDGHAATQRIRGELGLTELPVIALTAGALVSERQRALDMGMNDFISKPFDPQAMVRLIRTHVERTRGTLLPVVARVQTQEQDSAHPSWPEIDGIDRQDVMRRLDGDVDVFASMLRRMFEEFGDLDAGAPGSLSVAGRATLAARMHKLRGVAGVVAATTIQALAREAEEGLRDIATAQTDATLQALAAEIGRLRAACSAPLEHLAASRAAELEQAAVCPLDAADVAELCRLLQSRDLSALDRFKALAPALRAVRGEGNFSRIQGAVEDLEFGRALALLDEMAVP